MNNDASIATSTPPSIALRRSLALVLGGGHAFAKPAEILADVPVAVRGVRVDGVGRSLWELLEHVRRDQREMLDLCVAEAFAPLELWPERPEPPDEAAWEASVGGFTADLETAQRLALDETIDLYSVVPNGTTQTWLRVLQVIAEHNAYHLGQFVVMRRLLGVWSPG